MGTIVAMKECASGNESVGTEWVETAVFNEDDPIALVME